MTLLAPGLVALAGALASVPLRKRLRLVVPLALATLTLATGLVATLDPEKEERVADLVLRVHPLARLVDETVFVLLLLVTLYVALVEPVYNYFPVALFTAAAVHGVLVLGAPLPLFLLLVAGLLAPVVALSFRIHENRSLEASVRYFGSVTVGGSLGVAALALAAQQPAAPEEERLAQTLLLVLVIATFALLLGALPFHTHLAVLTRESPAAPLAIVFGVLVPLTFVAFLLLLTQSGVLPAIATVGKAQVVLVTLGVASALGGALLAIGAPDLQRLVAYSTVSNVGVALVGLATFSSPGIVGGIATVLVTGVAATQQLLAAGALGRAMPPEDRVLPEPRPAARHAPLAAATFVVSSVAVVGLPPLAGFPSRFLVEQIAFAVSAPLGAGILVASVALLVAHLRAGLRLFAEPPETWRLEARPVAGTIGLIVLAGLLAGGLFPDLYLRPIADFAREFLLALRPF